MSPAGQSPPKGIHRKTRSGVPMDELPVLQGWIARESNVVDKLINKRFGALYPSTFVTYRKETDDVSLRTSAND